MSDARMKKGFKAAKSAASDGANAGSVASASMLALTIFGVSITNPIILGVAGAVSALVCCISCCVEMNKDDDDDEEHKLDDVRHDVRELKTEIEHEITARQQATAQLEIKVPVAGQKVVPASSAHALFTPVVHPPHQHHHHHNGHRPNVRFHHYQMPHQQADQQHGPVRLHSPRRGG